MLKFTHSSLVQEGSTLTKEETRLISDFMRKFDPLHHLDLKMK